MRTSLLLEPVDGPAGSICSEDALQRGGTSVLTSAWCPLLFYLDGKLFLPFRLLSLKQGATEKKWYFLQSRANTSENGLLGFTRLFIFLPLCLQLDFLHDSKWCFLTVAPLRVWLSASHTPTCCLQLSCCSPLPSLPLSCSLSLKQMCLNCCYISLRKRSRPGIENCPAFSSAGPFQHDFMTEILVNCQDISHVHSSTSAKYRNTKLNINNS